jgi:hypothetical protein
MLKAYIEGAPFYNALILLVRPAGFEPATLCLEVPFLLMQYPNLRIFSLGNAA